MAANFCPICSGEIMTYRRFLKEADPSGISVCQCCGAHLRRSRGVGLRLAVLGLGASALTGLIITQAQNDAIPAWSVGAIILTAGVAFAGIARLLGWGTHRWVPTNDSRGRLNPG